MLNWIRRLFQKDDSEMTYAVLVQVEKTHAKFGYKITIELKPQKWRRSSVKKSYFVKGTSKYTRKMLKEELAEHLPDTVNSLPTIQDKIDEFLRDKIDKKQIQHL